MDDRHGEITDATKAYFMKKYGEVPDQWMTHHIVEYLVDRIEKLEKNTDIRTAFK